MLVETQLDRQGDSVPPPNLLIKANPPAYR